MAVRKMSVGNVLISTVGLRLFAIRSCIAVILAVGNALISTVGLRRAVGEHHRHDHQGRRKCPNQYGGIVTRAIPFHPWISFLHWSGMP